LQIVIAEKHDNINLYLFTYDQATYLAAYLHKFTSDLFIDI